jgi:hypothetical protein
VPKYNFGGFLWPGPQSLSALADAAQRGISVSINPHQADQNGGFLAILAHRLNAYCARAGCRILSTMSFLSYFSSSINGCDNRALSRFVA